MIGEDYEFEQAVIRIIQKRFGRRIDRHFNGTVQSVTGSAGNYTVIVKRTGASTNDPNPLMCMMPGYTPVVGDRVECMWRDEVRAYVLWKIPN
ncbi:MAG: hypothetical protein ACYDAY_11390 [Candidatus Dormibacteria bacterium]